MARPAIPEDQKRVKLNVTIAPATNNRLEALSAKAGKSVGRVIDQLIQDHDNTSKKGR